MGRFEKLLALFILTANCAWAQDQMAIRLNEKGIMKVLEMALKYNTSANNSRSMVVPGDLYKFTLKRADIVSNPIIPVINEISNLNLNKDINFYLKTSNIKVTGVVDPKSLRVAIKNSKATGFDFSISLNLPRINITAPQTGLCENKSGKVCGKGLKAFINNFSVVSKGRPLVMNLNLRLVTSQGVARIKVLSMNTNLESKSAPSVDLDFQSLDIPKISIVVNDVETELDTSKLRGEILKRKSFLAKKLVSFAADFIADDLTEMLNVYLVNKKFVTSWEIFRKQKDVSFDEFLSKYAKAAPVAKYQRPRVGNNVKESPAAVIMEQIADIIRQAQMTLSLSRISTPDNKDIEMYGLMNLILNDRRMAIRNTLGNTNRTLPKLDLSSKRANDLNLAISEPMINGALDLVNSTGLFQEVFDKTAGVQGFAIRSLKTHFTPQNTLVAVVNASIDLKNLSSKSMKDTFKHWIASFLERNNNNAVIYFPIEVEIIPAVKKLPNGGVALYLKVLSPFENGNLTNDYRYPTNVTKMYDMVRQGVMSDLRDNLLQYVNKSYLVDISSFMNQSGVQFFPKEVAISQSAYLMMSLDIADIKFNSVKPGLR
jgi:hypothetical protein